MAYLMKSNINLHLSLFCVLLEYATDLLVVYALSMERTNLKPASVRVFFSVWGNKSLFCKPFVNHLIYVCVIVVYPLRMNMSTHRKQITEEDFRNIMEILNLFNNDSIKSSVRESWLKAIILEGKSKTEVSAEYRVSRVTLYKHLNRFFEAAETYEEIKLRLGGKNGKAL